MRKRRRRELSRRGNMLSAALMVRALAYQGRMLSRCYASLTHCPVWKVRSDAVASLVTLQLLFVAGKVQPWYQIRSVAQKEGSSRLRRSSSFNLSSINLWKSNLVPMLSLYILNMERGWTCYIQFARSNPKQSHAAPWLVSRHPQTGATGNLYGMKISNNAVYVTASSVSNPPVVDVLYL